MDLDLWDCFGRKKLCLIIDEIRYVLNFKMATIVFVNFLSDRCILQKFILKKGDIFLQLMHQTKTAYTHRRNKKPVVFSAFVNK